MKHNRDTDAEKPGKRYGRRTVLSAESVLVSGHRRIVLQVRCDCGQVDRVLKTSLTAGKANQCAACRVASLGITATAERDRLQAENEVLLRGLRGKHELTGATYDHVIAERDQLRAEVEALRQDAERLDWLIEQGNVGCLVQEGTHGFWMAWLEEHDSGRHKYQDGHYATGRKAIDAAMAAKEGK